MNSNEIRELLSSYGYSEVYESRNGDDRTSSVVAAKQTTIGTTISCEFFATGDFRFTFLVPNSINKLTTDKCGSVKNTEHFNRIESKFIEQANSLQINFS